MAALRWGAATDPGQVREANEDTFVAEPMVFAVADGMGGHRAGEVASAFAASILRDRFAGGADNETYVTGVVAEANAAIFGAARTNPDQTGMGTTLTALTVMPGPASDKPGAVPERLALVNVGDSRTYRWRHDRLKRITVDHSYVQELVNTGHITEEEARTHPRRNIVTRALGIDAHVRADVWTLPIVRGDRFILCSDGLVDEVPDHEIADEVKATADPQLLAERLVAMANRHGGRDNITVVVVDVLEGEDPPDPTGEISFDPQWAEGIEEPPGWADDNDEPTAKAAFLPPILPPGTQPQTPPPPPTDGHTIVMNAANAAAATAAAAAAASPRSRKARERATDQVQAPRRSRFTIGTFLFFFILAAILTVTLTLLAVHARSGFFVAFDGDQVAVFKGQPDGFLWFEPTVNAPTTKTRDQLDPKTIALVEERRTFDSADAAAAFVTDFVTETTTTTTEAPTTTTSTTTPTTITGVTSTTIVGP